MVKYTYDAWGKILSTTGSLASTIGVYNPFRYRSYCYDTETGLYYLNSRYYDPEIGRFLSPDDFGYLGASNGLDSYNLFAYCGNNPVMCYDPYGNDFTAVANSPSAATAVLGMFASFIDGPLPIADILVAVAIAGILDQAVSTSSTSSGTAHTSSGRVLMPSASKSLLTRLFPPPSISLSKAETKVEDIVYFPPPPKTTYYHSTTLENAKGIISTGVMIGGVWEGGYVFAWRSLPNRYAVQNSGARMGVIISFETNALFSNDYGITDPRVKSFGPVRSVFPGPIIVENVKIERMLVND